MTRTLSQVAACMACVIVLTMLAGLTFAADQPNVILVITDDQGYGDVGAHGNSMINTPNLDQLHSDSVRLTDFHVDPTCAPTRSALMTGRYSARVGVWHTIMGRSLLRDDESTMANVFDRNGYATAMYGKWHLGDNYPFRPQDRGFNEVFCHGGGGVGQAPDYFGNDYFDDTYFRNAEATPEPVEGYCTDVWFDNAIEFIERRADEPFFVYLATNAPHGPFLVDPKYSDPYKEQGVPSPMAEFYGMIENIDENMGRLRVKLDELELTDNTILIFMTDNGTAAGVARNANDEWKGFNDGMRGQKGSEYEGGHRVPCFIHWPEAGLTGGRDVDNLSCHVDMLPTLIELCDLTPGEHLPFEGTSLAGLLDDTVDVDWASRTMFVESHRIDFPEKWRKSAVMTEQWRLVNGKELYDIVTDPSQTTDVAADNPAVVAQLTSAYEARWENISERFDEYVRTIVGSPEQNPTLIFSHDWHANSVPWNHSQIRAMPKANGNWAIDVAVTGTYRVTLRHQPEYMDYPLQADTARLTIGEQVDETRNVPAVATGVSFYVELEAGPAMMQTWLDQEDGSSRGAFYVEVELID
jgi:arylsulfatase A-like enzyme